MGDQPFCLPSILEEEGLRFEMFYTFLGNDVLLISAAVIIAVMSKLTVSSKILNPSISMLPCFCTYNCKFKCKESNSASLVMTKYHYMTFQQNLNIIFLSIS